MPLPFLGGANAAIFLWLPKLPIGTALLRCPECPVSFMVLGISAYSFRDSKISEYSLGTAESAIPFKD